MCTDKHSALDTSRHVAPAIGVLLLVMMLLLCMLSWPAPLLFLALLLLSDLHDMNTR